MLTHISKKELVEMAKRMRVDVIMPKDSLAQKQKAPTTTTQAPTEQDEETTSGLVFKRKSKATVAPTEHSHSNGQAPSHHVAPSEGQAPPLDVIVIQEGEAESSRGKNLWDSSFDVPTHGEHTFMPSDDKDKLMAHDEDQLYHDAMKQIGQVFAMGCLAISKTRAQKAAEDQKVQENLELRKKMELLQSDLQHSKGLL